MMCRHLALALSALLLVCVACSGTVAAQACPPGLATLTLTIGAPAIHVTAVDLNNKCAPLAPGTITWSPLGTPALANGVQDATGWMMTGLIAGTTTATLTSSATGSIPGTLVVTVVAPPVKVGVVSP